MDREQLFQRKALLERKAELIRRRNYLSSQQTDENLVVGDSFVAHPTTDGIGKKSFSRMIEPGYIPIEQRLLNVAGDFYGNVRENALETPELKSMRSGLSTKPVILGVSPQEAGKFTQGLAIDALSGLGGQKMAELASKKFVGSPSTNIFKSQQATNKAMELVNKILQPPKEKLAESVRKQQPLNVTEQVTKIIKPVKTAEELADIVRAERGGEIIKRGGIFSRLKPRDIGRIQLKPLKDLLYPTKEKSRILRMEPNEKNVMQRIFDREVEELNKLTPSEAMDINTLEGLKEVYQGKANKIYEARGSGSLTGNEGAKYYAYDALARGYKQAIEELANSVKNINKKIGGLGEAEELLSSSIAGDILGTPQSTASKIVEQAPRGTPQAAGAAVGRGILDFLFKKNIGKLSKQAYKQRVMSEQLGKLASDYVEKVPRATLSALTTTSGRKKYENS